MATHRLVHVYIGVKGKIGYCKQCIYIMYIADCNTFLCTQSVVYIYLSNTRFITFTNTTVCSTHQVQRAYKFRVQQQK